MSINLRFFLTILWGEFKWRELGIPYKLEGVKPPTKERVQNAKDLMETESYQDYLKRVKG